MQWLSTINPEILRLFQVNHIFKLEACENISMGPPRKTVAEMLTPSAKLITTRDTRWKCARYRELCKITYNVKLESHSVRKIFSNHRKFWYSIKSTKPCQWVKCLKNIFKLSSQKFTFRSVASSRPLVLSDHNLCEKVRLYARVVPYTS